MKRKELYRDAIKLWGIELQFGMLTEECGELLTAVNQWRRGRVLEMKVIEEMADVIIMIRQVLVVMGREPDSKVLEEMIHKKLNKMEAHIKKKSFGR